MTIDEMIRAIVRDEIERAKAEAREANALRAEVERLRAENKTLSERELLLVTRKGISFINTPELERLRAKAALADEHASWIRRGPPLDHGNTPLDEDWLSRYDAIEREQAGVAHQEEHRTTRESDPEVAGSRPAPSTTVCLHCVTLLAGDGDTNIVVCAKCRAWKHVGASDWNPPIGTPALDERKENQ